MKRFLLRRLLATLPTAWAILSIIFLLSRSLSANSEQAERLHSGSTLSGHSTSTTHTKALAQSVTKRLGLDLPLFYVTPAPLTPRTVVGLRWQWNGVQNQYHLWLTNLLRGNLGYSFRDGQSVTHLLGRALAHTLPLTSLAFVVTLAISYWLGLGLAQWPRTGRVLVPFLYLLHSLPLFLVALTLLLCLANPSVLAVFPAYGFTDSDPDASLFERVGNGVYHLTLPMMSLVIISIPALTIQLYSALQHELRADYITTARAKGLRQSTIIRRHALRNALLPAITYAAELVPALVAGAVVVELVFALPGMGRLIAEAAAARDFPVLLGGVLLIALVRLFTQIATDWLYYQADPRIRLEP